MLFFLKTPLNTLNVLSHKKIFQILKFNTSDYSNIEIFNYGVNNKDEIRDFYIPIKNSGMGSSKKILKNFYKEKVSLNKLDSNNFRNVGFIKVDVEGSEYEVLKSLDDIIKTSKPLISFELNRNNTDRKKIIDLLKNYGYYDFLVPEDYKFQNNRIIRIFKMSFKQLS